MDKPKLVQGTQDNKGKVETKKSDVAKVNVSGISLKEAVPANQISQREAVFLEVMKVVRDEKIVIGESQSFKSLITENQFKKIYSALMEGFRTSKIALKATDGNKQKLADNKRLEIYVIGLVNNWMRRDKRLNGTLNTKNKS